MAEEIEIFTDGACRGNPGPGGWGALLRYQGREKKLLGAVAETTNNRMELTAVIEALASLKNDRLRVKVTTDSRYVMDGIRSWLPNWKKRGWKTAAKKPVKNVDLWKSLDELHQRYDVEWAWVKGHSGHPGNEMADQLANDAIDKMLAENE